MTLTPRLILAALLLAVAGPQMAPAQGPVGAAIERSEQFNINRQDIDLRQSLNEALETEDQVQVPVLFPGEEADLGPQFIVRRVPKRKWIDLLFDEQYFYTSNAFLSEPPVGETDTTLLISTAQIAVAPSAFQVGEGALLPRVGFRYQWYNYGLGTDSTFVNNFDFDSMTVFTDVRYVWKDWIFGVGFDWNRLLGHEGPSADYSEFYKEYVPAVYVTRVFNIDDRQQFYIDWWADYRFTEVDAVPFFNITSDVNDRMDQNLRVTYTAEVYENLFVQPFIRGQYTYYTEGANSGRNDLFGSFGVTINYAITNWLSVRVFTNYDMRESDAPLIPDYENLNAGGGASVFLSF
ncbi:MAG: hypothetical protein AAGK14_00325 [Verrucomicrobiota bacterium]